MYLFFSNMPGKLIKIPQVSQIYKHNTTIMSSNKKINIVYMYVDIF